LHAGQFLIAKDRISEDKLMELAISAGADDIITTEQGYELRCDLHIFDKVAHAIEDAGIPTESAEISYIPTVTVPVTDVGLAKTLVRLHDALDDSEDVQSVYSNEEMDEAVTEAAHA
ncbi:MAG: YebC/PmpR family DNA-binding transcriptional regulator, partial [Candidatus Didemnitutus sp.]|nr:YebC/PmpR family DNA-binding transcriptional regulator [Candidatus Didemnitutus sp.]